MKFSNLFLLGLLAILKSKLVSSDNCVQKMEVCTPQIETICEDVTRMQMSVKDTDYCYKQQRTVCLPTEILNIHEMCNAFPGDPATEEIEVIVKDLSGNIISSTPLIVNYTNPYSECDEVPVREIITVCKTIEEEKCFNVPQLVSEPLVFKNCWPKIISNCTVQETECTLT